jgi:membrane protein DedA with SNARE-associated domain
MGLEDVKEVEAWSKHFSIGLPTMDMRGFLLLMFGIIGVPIPDETLLIFSGYLAFKGQLHILPTIVSAFLGSVCGITVSYGLGRIGGYALILRYGHWVHITDERIGRAREWLEHRGRWGLFIGYFIPGVRHLTALVAGTSRMRYSVFATFAYAGGLVWSTSFITAGFFLEKGWRNVAASTQQWRLIAFALVGCILLLYYLLQRKARRRIE